LKPAKGRKRHGKFCTPPQGPYDEGDAELPQVTRFPVSLKVDLLHQIESQLGMEPSREPIKKKSIQVPPSQERHGRVVKPQPVCQWVNSGRFGDEYKFEARDGAVFRRYMRIALPLVASSVMTQVSKSCAACSARFQPTPGSDP
jgi:hypothetical protein